jgi:hypothetical protein
MDTAKHLRHHSTVVRDGERKGLVSVGAAFRRRKSREAAARRLDWEREKFRAWLRSPDDPALTSRRRAELLTEREKVGAQA